MIAILGGLTPAAHAASKGSAMGAKAEAHAGAVAEAVIEPQFTGLTGYFHVAPSASRETRMDGWGMSMYSAIYPLKPGMDASTQLGWGTWMVANPHEDENGVWSPQPENPDGSRKSFCPEAPLPDSFQSNEGGIGSWGNVQYPIADPMFAIAATADCYATGVGGPAFAPSGVQPLDRESLYFAQLSNRMLLPPGPMSFEPVRRPSLFGYGWIALPVIPANASPYGIPTGTNTWTLFFHAANFKGPVGFFTPAFWTALNRSQTPPLSIGYGFDTRNNVGGSLAMEIGFTLAFTATGPDGAQYRRVPRLTFGVDSNGRATLAQDFKRYFKSAIWNQFGAWLNGGPAPSQMDNAGIFRSIMEEPEEGLTMLDAAPAEIDMGTVLRSAVYETSGGGSAFGIQWEGTLERGVLPEYYKKVDGTWTPIQPGQVPASTGLSSQVFPKLPTGSGVQVDTSSASPWDSSRWAAGPFKTFLKNGSFVEYVWYRFVDQPAMARLPLSEAERARLQAWAESVHNQGTNGLTIPPPSSGELVAVDELLLVTPPAGLTRGYVPIAIGQGPFDATRKRSVRH